VNVIIVGCGRVGVELALSLCPHHLVTVVDVNPRAFDRLGNDFPGRTVQGEGFDREVLKRAGVESAGALVAVTTSDNVNVVVARMARHLYRIQRVVARVYDPRRIPIYEEFGIQTVASSTWGARRIEQVILHPGMQSVLSTGNGEVQVYEISIPQEWHGQVLDEFLRDGNARPISLVRSGKAMMAGAGMHLNAQDILYVCGTAEGMAGLRQHLHENGKG